MLRPEVGACSPEESPERGVDGMRAVESLTDGQTVCCLRRQQCEGDYAGNSSFGNAPCYELYMKRGGEGADDDGDDNVG